MPDAITPGTPLANVLQPLLVETGADQPLPWGRNITLAPIANLAFESILDWFRLQLLWCHLPEVVLRSLIHSLQSFTVEPQTPIYREDQTPVGLYLLRSGTVEIVRRSPIGQSLICHRQEGDLFGYTVLSVDVYQTSAIALTSCEIWFLPQADFTQLVREHPSIQQIIQSRLSQDLHDYAARIAWEEVRIQGLQSYIQPVPHEAQLLGHSKIAQKLAEQAHQAATNQNLVVLQAPSGTGKSFLAGWIHAHSDLSAHPFAELDCAELPRSEDGRLNTDALFGREGHQAGLLVLLERGTLLLDNVQVLSEGDRTRLLHYCKTGWLLPNHGLVGRDLAAEPPQLVRSWVRLLFASPQKVAVGDVEASTIKLLTLPQRKADIPEFARHFLAQFCREQNRPELELDQSDLRRLLSYEYPGNLPELAEILHRAVIMTPEGNRLISEQVLWSVQSTKNAFRLDLLTHVPGLRALLLSRWYPNGIWVMMMAVFVPVTLLGFIGPQSRTESITLNLFWAWWWPGYLFLFAFVGRLWCAVCPFMIVGEGARRLSLWLFPRQQLPWNTPWLNRWGGWFMFVGFLLIYLWEQLWDLPHHAYLSAWLLTIIAAGAVLCSLIYERRLWCRYLCPIGGMNGMFAKLSMIELRSTPQVCGSQCHTFGCYKGSAATPITFADALPTEGQASDGCPLYSHPAQLQDNRDCMLCMTCLKTCPNRSAQLNLRFPASDLLDQHQGFWAEIALLLLLCGGVFMHYHATLLGWLGWNAVPLDAAHFWRSVAIALTFLSLPAILTYGVHLISRLFDPALPFYRTVIYAYLPFTLAANLTYYIPAAITEAGQALPVLARTLGYSGDALPTLTWSPDVATFLQGVTLLSALVFSPYPLLRINQRPWLSSLPHLLLLVSLTVICFNCL